MSDVVERLRSIKTFLGLIKYLRDDLDWPIESDDVENLTFEYEPEELGLDAKHAVKIKEIKQLRPLDSKQPWGIFWVNFEKKRLPMVVLRRILGNLVVKKRKSANKTDRPNWQLNDLLFISSYGEEEHRTISFAHFTEDPDTDELPVLRVLGWDDQNSIMHLDRVANRLHTQFRWPDKPAALDAWRKRWSEAFTDRYQEAIRSAAELIPRLARLARTIRKRVKDTLDAESEHGPMRRLLAAVRGLLIHDMNEDAFADMYAQTVAYGLLSARFSRPADLTAQNLVQLTSVSNPFLENLLENLFRLNRGKFHFDVDEVGINDVLDLLRKTNIEAIKAAFNDENPAEDPVIRFYEGFLKEYDPKQRIQRGIFFTPRPVVSYIVRSVHELLQTEFGLEDGLASTATWADMLKKFPHLKLPDGVKPEDQFVCILDPATGTGTFLFTCIEVVERTMKDKWCRELGKKSWNDPEIAKCWRDYVPKYLLPRLYGYELMMAPYAIAHLKLALKLGETGYQFREGDRLHIYLTNSLEPPSEVADPKLADLFATLAKEAQEVNEIKRRKRFTVVIGNPPYANFGQLNRIPFILNLLEDYKRSLGEKKLNLDDDYLKFFRLGQYTLAESGAGVFGMITNSSFLDGLIHRRMRELLLQQFPQGHILDLHGNSRRGDAAPDDSADENVFDIQQGVAISLWAHSAAAKGREVKHGYLWGKREEKYAQLAACTALSTRSARLEPKPPQFFFIQQNVSMKDQYEVGVPLAESFSLIGSGLNTDRDELCIDFDKPALAERMQRVFSGKLDSDSEFIETYNLRPSSSYDPLALAKRQSFDPKAIRICIYRPFDFRHIYYKVGFTSRPVFKVQGHMLQPNLGLLVCRQSKEPFAVLATRRICTHKIVAVYDRTSLAPLWLYQDRGSGQQALRPDQVRTPTFTSSFAKVLCTRLQLAHGQHGLPVGLAPEDIFHYAYGVFYSPEYRRRYAEFLKTDFPRLPLTGSLELFRALARLGGELVSLHLMESPKLDKHITEFVGNGDAEVAKGYPKYKDRTVWINNAQEFKGVPEEVWSFHIGGYQVCEKWLKDRRGQQLTKSDIEHYQKILVALNETIRLMSEIDKVIDRHGGWPSAFMSTMQKANREKADIPMAAGSSVSYRKGECGN